MRPLQIIGLAALLGAVSTPVLAEPPTADSQQHLRDVFDRAAKEAVDLDEMESALGLNGLRIGEWSKVAPYGEQPGKAGAPGTAGASGQPGAGGVQVPAAGGAPLQPGSPSGTGDTPSAPGGPTPVASPITSDGPSQSEPDLILARKETPTVKVPVPASALLLGIGLFGLAALGTRRRFFLKRRPV